MGNASQINRSRNSVRVERRSDLNESDLGEFYCIYHSNNRLTVDKVLNPCLATPRVLSDDAARRSVLTESVSEADMPSFDDVLLQSADDLFLA